MGGASWIRRLFKALLILACVVLAALVTIWWLTKPTGPDEFYTATSPMPDKPGVLIKAEPFTRMVPSSARGWRILYSTTRFDGKISAASAIVLAPQKPADKPADIILWTHGTTGVAPACAPSLMEEPFANVPALDEALNEGWVFLAPDYIGLGTEGPHPYLIGEGEARSALDSLRALRDFVELSVTGNAVVWGHSQGGNAALWTGIFAPSYAPELSLNGIAAAAPASDLVSLTVKAQGTPVGAILSSYIIAAYSGTYPDVNFDENVRTGARWLTRDMATRCMDGTKAIFLVAEGYAARPTIFASDPSTGALGARLRQNTPIGSINVPVLLAQGENDELVLLEIQNNFFSAACAAGQRIEYVPYPDRDHLSLVAKDSPLTSKLISWTRSRFAGEPGPESCVKIDHAK